MNIAIHDYPGHPFQLQLARWLAGNGHRVHHLYCASLAGPKGDLAARGGEAGRLSIEGLETGRPVDKARLVRRFVEDRRYGRVAARRIAEIGPDAVLCANTPLDALRAIQARCRKEGIRIVNWLQDLVSVAAADILPRKIPLLGTAIARHHLALERRLLRRADHIIPISDDFHGYLSGIGIAPGGYTTIGNWAPLDEIPARPRRNGWGERHGLNAGRTVIYSGDLGFKYDAGLLIHLAEAMREASPHDRLVVVSEGAGAEWLARRQAAAGLPNLLLLPFQAWEDVPDMMASADILLALLEPQAKPYSVPSKVLSYCCAGRAIALSADAGNLASRIVERNGCGRVVAAGAAAPLARAVLELLRDEGLRMACGANARRYAQAAFDIETIGPRFEAVLEAAVRDANT